MITINDYPYFQPQHADGSLPEYLLSNQAFQTEQSAIDWLDKYATYEKPDFEVHEYANDDLADVVLIDADGDIIPKIESLSDNEIEDLITGEVLLYAGSIDNLRRLRQSDETEDTYKDRMYGEAHEEVMEAIGSIEESNDYDFSSYGGNPDTEWYDEARHNAVIKVMNWMMGEEDD